MLRNQNESIKVERRMMRPIAENFDFVKSIMFPRQTPTAVENGAPAAKINCLVSDFINKYVTAAPVTLPSSVTIMSIEAQLPTFPYVVKD
jgi:hypothetical protein